jgi:hypothetical protein
MKSRRLERLGTLRVMVLAPISMEDEVSLFRIKE